MFFHSEFHVKLLKNNDIIKDLDLKYSHCDKSKRNAFYRLIYGPVFALKLRDSQNRFLY